MGDPRLLRLKTFEDMAAVLKDKGRGLESFKKGDTVKVWNKMEKDYSYSYVLEEEPGKGFAEEFKPHADPGEILALGAFGGKYLNDCLLEFPAEWFWRAGLLGKLSPGGTDISLNYFKIDSRLPLTEWRKAGWVPQEPRAVPQAPRGVPAAAKKLKGVKSILSDPQRNPDIRGWFQWYCRYWMGRRLPELDAVQIQRWRSFKRHYGAVQKGCKKSDLSCRPRQRQALLQWAWPFAD
jgi:hypothetical protein